MKLLNLLILFPALLLGQETILEKNYAIQYGTLPNIEAGTESVLGLSSLVFDQVNLSIEEKIEGSGLRVASRLANFTFVQLYLGGLFYGTFLHEHFGHNLRASEFGLPLDLQYNFPGLGGDFTFPVDYNVPVIERQLVIASGLETTSLLAYKTIQKLYGTDYSGSYIGLYLLAGKLIEGVLTVQSETNPFIADANKYYANNFRLKRNPTPNDPLAYLLALTESYGYYDGFIDKESLWVQRQPDMSVYTQNNFIGDQNDRIKNAFLLTALDPALLYFLYGTSVYLANGTSFIKPFMFKLNQVSFMPSIRASYGELGAENYFDVFFKIQNAPPFSVYYRKGGNVFDKINGAGFEIRKIRYKQFSFEGQIDYWQNGRDNSNNYNVYLKAGYSLPSSHFILTSGLGYKSKGVLMGKPFDNGLYAYVGGGIKLSYKKKKSVSR